MALVSLEELPADLLVDVLRRLAPRSLAASRCVCRAWRDAVDSRRLLRADLLPRSLRGLFINYAAMYCSDFLSRPSTGPAISGMLDFLPGKKSTIVRDHCSGLLLCADGHHEHVVNPATRRWSRLPPRPPSSMGKYFGRNAYLVFDPAESPHYEVFLIPFAHNRDGKLDPATMELEWPPASYTPEVFSSMTGQWEKRSFSREEGNATRLIGDMKFSPFFENYRAVHWRGALYVHCEHHLVIRISLSNGKYQVVEPPPATQVKRYPPSLHLGKSEKGVYFARTYNWHGLDVWFLSEASSQMEWVLKHQVWLMPFTINFHALENYHEQFDGPWILQNCNHYKYFCHDNLEPLVEKTYGWNSDDDNVLNIEDKIKDGYHGYVSLLGFHPFKEVVFLDVSCSRAVAYHWNNSKFQDLGNICPIDYDEIAGHSKGIEMAFPYTPCWIEEFPENNVEAQLED